MRLGSGIEQDDVGRLGRVGGREEDQAGVLRHDVLERPPAAGGRRHDEHSYHGATGAWERRTHASTAAAGTASARLPCIMVLTPTSLPVAMASGAPENPGRRGTSNRVTRGAPPSRAPS